MVKHRLSVHLFGLVEWIARIIKQKVNGISNITLSHHGDIGVNTDRWTDNI